MSEVERGFSKLDAVNILLRSIALNPVTALDTGGNSEQGDAERVIDEVDQEMQTRGVPENTVLAVAHVAALDTGSYFIDFDSTILRVKCVAPARYRDAIVMRKGRAYNSREQTSNFGSAVTLYFDEVVKLAWDYLEPTTKHDIIAEATLRFRRRKMPNPAIDSMLQQERVEIAGGVRQPIVPPMPERKPAAIAAGGQPQ